MRLDGDQIEDNSIDITALNTALVQTIKDGKLVDFIGTVAAPQAVVMSSFYISGTGIWKPTKDFSATTPPITSADWTLAYLAGDVINSVSLDGTTFTLNTSGGIKTVDLASLGDTISTVTFNQATSVLTISTEKGDKTVDLSVLTTTGDTISTVTLAGTVLTVATDKGNKTVELGSLSGDTISNLTLNGSNVLTITTDKGDKTVDLSSLATTGDTITTVTLDGAYKLTIATDKGNKIVDLAPIVAANTSDTLTGLSLNSTTNILTITTDKGSQTVDLTPMLANAPVKSVNNKTGIVNLSKVDIGLANVDNTSDALKPVSTAVSTALDLKANDTSVVHLTGDESIAGNKTFSNNIAVSGSVITNNAIPPSYFASGGMGIRNPNGNNADNGTGMFVTVEESSFGGFALGYVTSNPQKWLLGISNNNADRTSFSILEDSLASKPRFVIATGGNVGIGTNSPTSKLAVDGVIHSSGGFKFPDGTIQLSAANASLNSPAFTGTPTAPTQPALDNSTKLATTAYVTNAVAGATGGGVTKEYVDNADAAIQTELNTKLNAAEIGNLNNLQTTIKTDIVSAINELKADGNAPFLKKFNGVFDNTLIGSLPLNSKDVIMIGISNGYYLDTTEYSVNLTASPPFFTLINTADMVAGDKYYGVVSMSSGDGNNTSNANIQPDLTNKIQTENAFSATSAPYFLFNEIEYTLNGGTDSITLSEQMKIGDICTLPITSSYIANKVGFRTKAFQGKAPSNWLFNDYPFNIQSISMQKMKITIVYTNAATSQTIKMCPFLYNKDTAVSLVLDDGMFNALPIAQNMANDIPAMTDGAGNRVNYTFAFAPNGRSNYNNNELATGGSTMSFAEMSSLISAGHDILNHGMYHELDGNYKPTSIGNNIDLFHQYVYDNLSYVMRVGVRPNSDMGYIPYFDQINYLAATSQGSEPNYPFQGESYYTVAIETMPIGFKHIYRDFDDFDNGQTSIDKLINRYDMALADASPTAHTIEVMGMHGADATTLQTALANIHTRSNDRVWVAGLHRILEYRETIANVVVDSDTIVGNTRTIELNFANCSPKAIRDDLSILVGSGIQSVQIENSDSFTYNPSNGLINIKKKRVLNSINGLARTN